jgi:hypothetical protein
MEEKLLLFFDINVKIRACTNWNVAEAIFTAPFVVSISVNILVNNSDFVILRLYISNHITKVYSAQLSFG